jgi:hypothetical protein
MHSINLTDPPGPLAQHLDQLPDERNQRHLQLPPQGMEAAVGRPAAEGENRRGKFLFPAADLPAGEPGRVRDGHHSAGATARAGQQHGGRAVLGSGHNRYGFNWFIVCALVNSSRLVVRVSVSVMPIFFISGGAIPFTSIHLQSLSIP